MPRKVDKGWAIDRLIILRAEGKTIKELCAALGLGKSQVSRYIQAFDIQRGKKVPKCPHCGVALRGLVR